jgi:Domain of unknown function (DUF6794)
MYAGYSPRAGIGGDVRMKWIVIILLLVNAVALNADLRVSDVYSANKEYRAESVEYSFYSDYLNATDGQTKVYHKFPNAPMYKINRRLDVHDLYLSNDGSGLLYIDDRRDSILFYKNGNLKKSYYLEEVLECNKKEDLCYLTYSNPYIRLLRLPEFYFDTPYSTLRYIPCEIDSSGDDCEHCIYYDVDSSLIFADKHPIITYKDTLFIITQNLELLHFNLATGEYKRTNFVDKIDQLKNYITPRKIIYSSYAMVDSFDALEYLGSGERLIEAFAKKFQYKCANSYDHYDEYFDYCTCSVSLKVNNKGEMTDLKVECDSLINSDTLKQIILEYGIKPIKIPKILDEWEFHEYFEFWHIDTLIARCEQEKYDSAYKALRQEERIKNSQLDTLYDFYIPKDLEECNLLLDSLFDGNLKYDFDNLQDINGIIWYHHGLGTWLRNSLGLWSGSRLAKFFEDRDITHPDNMSGYILESYYWYRHGKEYDIDAELKKFEQNKKETNE